MTAYPARRFFVTYLDTLCRELACVSFDSTEGTVHSRHYICPTCGVIWMTAVAVKPEDTDTPLSFTASLRPCEEHGDGCIIGMDDAPLGDPKQSDLSQLLTREFEIMETYK